MTEVHIRPVKNGFFIKELGGDSFIASTISEALQHAENLLTVTDEQTPIETTVVTDALAEPSQPEKDEGVPEDMYEKLLAGNDRAKVHAMLKEHVSAGAIDEYNVNLGTKKLVELLKQLDAKKSNPEPEPKPTKDEPPAEPPAEEKPPVDPFAPKPPEENPFAEKPKCTVDDVRQALQKLFTQKPDRAYELLSEKGDGAKKIEDLKPEHFDALVAACKEEMD